jgi:hypothetical protein
LSEAGRRREVGHPAFLFLVPPAARIGLFFIVAEVDSVGGSIRGVVSFVSSVTFGFGFELADLDHGLGHHVLVAALECRQHQIPVGCCPHGPSTAPGTNGREQIGV